MNDLEKNNNLPWKIAAPSFIWPTRVGENCRLLAPLVQEVGIVLFETQGSLEYTQKDLPLELKDLGLDYHVHLPLDLPWEQGSSVLNAQVKGILEKIAFLNPWGYVLHPPPELHDFKDFLRAWRGWGLDSSALLLENIEGHDLSPLWKEVEEQKCSICLDLGHLLVYEQEKILEYPNLWPKVQLLHIYAPSGGHKHHSLAKLDSYGQKVLQRILNSVKKDCTVLLEVFGPEDLRESLQAFHSWCAKWNF
jgi:hypothetical protein